MQICIDKIETNIRSFLICPIIFIYFGAQPLIPPDPNPPKKEMVQNVKTSEPYFSAKFKMDLKIYK
ncbi:MAG: hypothetical protein BA863_03940 [Desulfovibrio sp. S3730MH75]|nr:MAG: hypothetical protein BA863_03940 [Desulfovibrio sp. S3730MH75]